MFAGSLKLVLKGMNNIFEGFWNLRIGDGKLNWLRENGWITKPSKRFRETKHLIYSGSVTLDLHPLP